MLDDAGRVLNHNLHDSLIPSIGDAPEIVSVAVPSCERLWVPVGARADTFAFLGTRDVGGWGRSAELGAQILIESIVRLVELAVVLPTLDAPSNPP